MEPGGGRSEITAAGSVTGTEKGADKMLLVSLFCTLHVLFLPGVATSVVLLSIRVSHLVPPWSVRLIEPNPCSQVAEESSIEIEGKNNQTLESSAEEGQPE